MFTDGDCRLKLLFRTVANKVAQKQTLENKKTFYCKIFTYKMVLIRILFENFKQKQQNNKGWWDIKLCKFILQLKFKKFFL